MHPLVSAYRQYWDCARLDIRPWSPYCNKWLEMCDELHAELVEITHREAALADAAKYAIEWQT